MATMNISIPDQMKSWVEAQSESGKYSNNSDYVRDLIRRDQERAEKIAAMQKLVNHARERGGRNTDMELIRQEGKRVVAFD